RIKVKGPGRGQQPREAEVNKKDSLSQQAPTPNKHPIYLLI
ncbi:hypothetical protein CCACVL1_03362, partial [Corchorus capsularis]